MTETGAAPRLARPFVAAFLVAMLAAALFAWEPWPITSFRLFSHLRAESEAGWVASPAGSGNAFLHFGFKMREFEAGTAARRDSYCRAWVAALGPRAGEPARMEIYRVTRDLGRRVDGGERAAPPAKSGLAYVCTPAGARAAGATG